MAVRATLHTMLSTLQESHCSHPLSILKVFNCLWTLATLLAPGWSESNDPNSPGSLEMSRSKESLPGREDRGRGITLITHSTFSSPNTIQDLCRKTSHVKQISQKIIQRKPLLVFWTLEFSKQSLILIIHIQPCCLRAVASWVAMSYTLCWCLSPQTLHILTWGALSVWVLKEPADNCLLVFSAHTLPNPRSKELLR